MQAVKNKVQLIGNIDSPNIRVTENNIKVADILLQTEESYRNKEGEKLKNPMWHKCRAYGKLADIIDKYIVKGVEVAIEGSLIQSSYSFNGKIVQETYIQLNELLILTKRK